MSERGIIPEIRIGLLFIVFLTAVRVVPLEALGRVPVRPIDYVVGIGFALRLALGIRSIIPTTIAGIFIYALTMSGRDGPAIVLIYACGYTVGMAIVWRLNGREPWLRTPNSVAAVIIGGAAACTLDVVAASFLVSSARVTWFLIIAGIARELSGIVALAPVVLVCLSAPLRRLCGLSPDPRAGEARTVHWREAMLFSGLSILIFWMAVVYRVSFGLDLVIVGFAPLIIIAGTRGIATAAVSLGTAVLCGGFLWSVLDWITALSLGDLRLIVLAASITTLITAAQTEQGNLARRHLQSRIADFRNLVSRTEDARETERTALARDVHDNLGQLLTGLKINLKMISAGNVGNPQSELSAALTDVDAILAQVERMGNELGPDIGRGAEPVQDTLQRLTDECSKRFSFTVTLRSETIDLEPSVAHTIVRIVQEALTNIARHAEARSAVVSLFQNSDEVCVNIEDDGKGFARTPEGGPGLGIIGMRERAFLIGGTLDISQGTTRGTVVKVRIPGCPRLALKARDATTASLG